MGILKNLFKRTASDDQCTPTQLPGRNDSCWCGSGKKYKKCHLEHDSKKRSKNFSLSCGST